VLDDVGAGDEGDRRQDDLVAAADRGQAQRDGQAGRARAEADDVWGREVRAQVAFELGDLRPGDQPARPDRVGDLGQLGVPDDGLGDTQEVGAQRPLAAGRVAAASKSRRAVVSCQLWKVGHADRPRGG
jgi:hypothetical protein